MLCSFPERFQKELYRDRSYVLAPGMISPTGTATPAPGGAIVKGRWQQAGRALLGLELTSPMI